jgi:glycosyltransferase involved in cell wall biosynthesis
LHEARRNADEMKVDLMKILFDICMDSKANFTLQASQFQKLMSKISAVIVAHNEEKKISGCLENLDFVDEIVVVLDKCTDKTKEIALSFNAKIIEGSWKIEGARRNVAVNAASNEWVLEIDADERVSKELKEEIKQIVKSQKPTAFIAPIHNYVGKRFVQFGWLRTLCVLERQTMHYIGSKVYDEDKEVHPTATLRTEVKYLTNPIIHLVDDNIADLIARFNRYTTWKANDMIATGKIKGGFFPSILSLKMRFIKSYFVKKGYKEGLLGILIAMLAGLYPVVSYLKAKEQINENR